MLTAEKTTPTEEDAGQLIANWQARVWVRFGIRVVLVAICSAFLVQSVPFIAANRALLDALSGVVVLWPLWTQLGHVYKQRIRLGEAFQEADEWENAQKILSPFGFPPVSRLFDTTGEGTYRLACALDHLGKTGETRALHTQNARPTEWGKKSAALLHDPGRENPTL